MGKLNVYQHAWNAGVQDAVALPRVDLERMRLAAEVQTNLLPLAVGRAFTRPGLGFLSSTKGNQVTRLKEFVFGATDAALMEFSDQSLRVRVNDQLITRPAVTASVVNGNFGSSSGWSLDATAGATCVITGNTLQMRAQARGASASADQQVTVNQQGVEHALRIVINLGPVNFRCGSTPGGDEYIADTGLTVGTHSLAFVPTTGSFYISFQTESPNLSIVKSINVEAAGVLELPTPWAAGDMGLMRFSQSADVVFVACRGYQQRRIERRSPRSWSVVLYLSNDGPFAVATDNAIKLTPSETEGGGTLTASAPFFKPSDVGAMFRLFHSGYNFTNQLAGDDQYSDAVRASGIEGDNEAFLTLSGTWSGTITVQWSYDGPDSGFIDQNTLKFTENGRYEIDPGERYDNVVLYYRAGFLPGDYVSGVANVNFTYKGGGGYGICRVTGFNSPTSVAIEILKPFTSVNPTADWRRGEWSADGVWPSAVAFADGRLWWSGEDRIWGSVSDAFHSFDEDYEGDSAPILRSIAIGGINDTQWLMSLQRLVIGTEGAIAVAKSSSLDEPLTVDQFTIKESSTLGVAPVEPAKIDNRGLTIERAGRIVVEVVFDAGSADYKSVQMSKLTTKIFSSGVRELAVQRRPDTRIWIITNDGNCICCVYEPDQEVMAFVPIQTDGAFESVAVLPAVDQDRVYFSIRRTVNGQTVRYIEKMAMDEEVVPSTLAKVMDAYRVGSTPVASATINVGTHVAGKNVVVWADGKPVETAKGQAAKFTVAANGNITLPYAVTNWIAGLPYTVQYKSARLAYGAEGGTAMLQKKSVDELGLIMTDFTRWGVKAGSSFDSLYDLPSKVFGMEVPDIVLGDVHDECPFTLGGSWGLDSRVCIEWSSPYTATLLGMTVAVTTNG
ncbi:hypothetical protein [Brucella sp. IR073]|uniref:hypothetical protein n=1 Tax=unclassified Brucella TaxID=2632610 RepID=UPI003B9829AD